MSRHFPKYDPSIREELDKADWANVLPPVFKYAIWRAKKFAWIGDEVDPDSLVNEAIARAYGFGTGNTYRNWNKDKCPKLENFLIGIIRSMTSHKAEHVSDFPKESLFNEDGSTKDDKLLKFGDETEGFQKPKTPEEKLIEADNLQSIMDELDKLSDEDEALGMIILCIEDEISKTRHIAEATGYDRKKVNNLLRQLRRRLENYNPKLQNNLPKKGRKNEHR